MPPKTPPPAEGLCFPITEGSGPNAVRSTTETGKKIIAAALKAADADAAKAVSDERKWRFKYNKHIVKMVEVGCKKPENALKIAQAGLDYMYANFEFVRDDKTYKLGEALDKFKGSFGTATIRGSQSLPSSLELGVPYNGKTLRGEELQKQLDKWVRAGTIEMSCGAAIAQVADAGSAWLDLHKKYFVLLGAGAAMGPLNVLLSLGANVIAVDVPESTVPGIWKRIIGTARASPGTLTFPVVAGFDQNGASDEALTKAAGCNLFTQLPEVKNWLLSVHPDKQLAVGGYAYIPGDLFPRVALAMDAIIKYLTEKRKASVAFLCTPTDVHLVPPAAYAASKANLAKAPLWQKLLTLLSSGKMCKPNPRRPVTSDAGEPFYVCDALVVAQGPNYALAKRMQHWRAMVARELGCIVSSNIAPSTKTASVTQNKNFAYAYETIPNWKPYEIPGPETSNAVMTALLLHDLNHPMHAGSPAMPLSNPQQIFSQGSFHGGTWRCAHTFDSIGVPAVILYYLKFFLVKNYLLMYNLVQALGWGLVLYRCVLSYLYGLDAWSTFGGTALLFQNLACLEVVHSLLGFVPSKWHATLLQISSRLAVVNMAALFPDTHASKGLHIIGFAWGFTEVVRYSWYALNLLTTPPKPLTWLRYSTFLLLYPLGVLGEMMLFTAALPSLGAVPAVSLTLGNWPTGLLTGWSLADVVKYIVWPAYVPGLPFLYGFMLTQRNKALSSGVFAKKVKTA